MGGATLTLSHARYWHYRSIPPCLPLVPGSSLFLHHHHQAASRGTPRPLCPFSPAPSCSPHHHREQPAGTPLDLLASPPYPVLTWSPIRETGEVRPSPSMDMQVRTLQPGRLGVVQPGLQPSALTMATWTRTRRPRDREAAPRSARRSCPPDPELPSRPPAGHWHQPDHVQQVSAVVSGRITCDARRSPRGAPVPSSWCCSVLDLAWSPAVCSHALAGGARRSPPWWLRARRGHAALLAPLCPWTRVSTSC